MNAPEDRIAALRKEYSRAVLNEDGVQRDPFAQFRLWFRDALSADLPEATAMALATAAPEGRPSVRMVLLKGVEAEGFLFYTNYESRKGSEIARNPAAALLFYWAELERQVRIEGFLSRVTDAESDEYFASRPRESQLGAWASRQSAPLPGRDVLEREIERLRLHYDGRNVPRPPQWGGYRLQPDLFEFWQGRPNRLHDRIRYRREHTAWVIERLSP